MRLDVRKLQIVGATPGVFRRIGVVPSGLFEGERLSGEILEGGADWQAVRDLFPLAGNWTHLVSFSVPKHDVFGLSSGNGQPSRKARPPTLV